MFKSLFHYFKTKPINVSSIHESISTEEKAKVRQFIDNSNLILKNKRLNDTSLVALDFETTGLSDTDHIISLGICPIHLSSRNTEHCVENNSISTNYNSEPPKDFGSAFSVQLKDCQHFYVKTQAESKLKNTTLHGITHDKIKNGLTPTEAFWKLFDAINGKIIVAHHHGIEKTFLQRLSISIIGIPLPLYFIDTLTIAQKRSQRQQKVLPATALRLFNLRKTYQLPNYHAHNALEDAIATAELFFAQVAESGTPIPQIKLTDLHIIK